LQQASSQTRFELHFPAVLGAGLRKHIYSVAPKYGLVSETEKSSQGVFVKLVVAPEDFDFLATPTPKLKAVVAPPSNSEAPPKRTNKMATVAPKKSRRTDKIPKGMSEIVPNFLYLGSAVDAGDADLLLENEITHVLNVAKGTVVLSISVC